MLRNRHRENIFRPILGCAISHTKLPFFTFSKKFKKSKKPRFCIRNYALGVYCMAFSIGFVLEHFFLCRHFFPLEIWETILPVFRVFQRKLKVVPKKGHFLAFLRHPLWPNDIIVAPDG